MKLTKPTVLVSYQTSGSIFSNSRFFSITIKNPNAVGKMSYTIVLYGNRQGETVELKTKSEPNVTDSKIHTEIGLDSYYNISSFKITVSAEVYRDTTLDNNLTVAELCESTKQKCYRPVTAVQKQMRLVYLKAFCNLPFDQVDVYGFWEQSTDGVTWQDCEIPNISLTAVTITVPEATPDLESGTVRRKAYLIPKDIKNSNRLITNSPDVLPLTTENIEDIIIKRYRFGMCSKLSGTANHEILLGFVEFTPVFSNKIEFLYSDILNASNSSSLYYDSTLYAYSNPKFKNNLIATFPGETVRPLSLMLPLNTYESAYITALIPWKNYLVAFTETSSHLVSKFEGGFQTSTLNTFIGIPKHDANCCKAILNGIIFKSGTKIYMLYPNMYAGSDSVLNLTELSKPIEDYLQSYVDYDIPPFAITTDSAYLLFIPQKGLTKCVKYEYSSKRWSLFEYPVEFQTYTRFSPVDIRLMGYVKKDNRSLYVEYFLDRDLNEVYPNVSDTFPYRDYLYPSSIGIPYDMASWDDPSADKILKPIHFTVDTGQKFDIIGSEVQFVETKVITATLHKKDAFPMTALVHIEGNPYVTRDLLPSSDGGFARTSVKDTDILATNINMNPSDIINTYRQMFIRYSGKGKSIRHIIEGDSLYPFKLYSLECRYKNINTKQ